MQKKIYGSQCVLLTPLNEDETVDKKSTKRLIDYVITNGVHGVLAQSTTGEAFLFDTDERKTCLDLALECVDGRTPVGFTVESPSTAISVDLAKYAEKAGADYLFTTAPYRVPHTGAGIYEHFKAINDAVNLPILIYDGGAGIEFGLDLYEKISENLQNIKYSKIFVEKPGKIPMITEATHGKIIPWAGHDRCFYQMLLYGASGMTSACSCIVPGEITNIVDYIQAGEIEKAREIYLKTVCPLTNIAVYSVLDFIACYKMALYFMGIITTPTVRKPLMPLNSIMQTEIREALKFIGKL